MKLCFSTLGCPNWRWDDIIAAAVDLGYNGIEIRGVGSEMFVPRIKQLNGESLAKSTKRLKDLNLQIPVLTSGCELQDTANVGATILSCKEYIDKAAQVGAQYVRVLGDTNPAPANNVDEALVKESAQILGAYAHTKNVTLLIESNGHFANSERLAKLLSDINSPGVAALWDLNHPYRYNNESVENVISNLGNQIKHVHIKDSINTTDGLKYKVTGQGDLPIKQCVNSLAKIGFDGYFSLEWVRRWDTSLEEPGIAFALYAQYMRSL